ncbi:probable receptor-like serine/threonine-protein kinase At4g34500 isoform X2 [Jatropha curcas]|uniref:probable receptor-like serine/threonine-protein kinase At4g34500 isoform X2 n=1 Tax=Jatropha curcas TaxID=180498 RepID=UPI0009D749FC|nr:probable receptor-like serine/threonine-protein kinase At4g34500 isoform X2 [Jatropha curcas]
MSVSGTDTSSTNSSNNKLSSETPFLNLKLYVLISIISICVLLVFLIVFLCIRLNRTSRKRNKVLAKQSSGMIPLVSKEIEEIKALDREVNSEKEEVKIGNVIKKKEIETVVDLEIGEGKQKQKKSAESDDASYSTISDVSLVEAQQNIGWGRWYSLKELEIATHGFSEENVIGEGGYGIVYRGELEDGSVVAVKNLLNNKGQAEKEFRVEVEAIGKVRHKNLVGLLGYCAEGARRMLVYEYVDNGNLEQWLHGDVGPVSPLTWDIRMKIAIGTAKGYVSPDYASTGMLNEGSDVYSFGVLLMEMITGRSPIDYSRPAGEMNLVDWFKGMVASRRGEEALDPLIQVQPSPRALKRTLLVCLRCIDLDANKRPKMGQIVHMLEADDFPFRAELRSVRDKDNPASHADASNKVPHPTKHGGGNDVERSRRR